MMQSGPIRVNVRCPPLQQSKDNQKEELSEYAKNFLKETYEKLNDALTSDEAKELLAKSKLELEKQVHRAVEKGKDDVHKTIEVASTPEAQAKMAEWKVKVTETLHAAVQKGGEEIKKIAADSKKK